MSAPRLTLLVITHNRSRVLAGQITRLAAMLREVEPGRVELLVSDNASADDTATVAAALLAGVPGARFRRQERHEWSSEGHVRAALAEAAGDYVWIISDDDWIDPLAVPAVLEALESDPAFIFMNPAIWNIRARQLDKPAGWLSPFDLGSSEDPARISYLELLIRTGLSSALTNYSCTIADRRLLTKADWDAYYGIMQLGALIPTFLDAFSGRPGLVMVQPLVHLTIEPARLDPARLDNDYHRFFKFSGAIDRPTYYWWYLYPVLFIEAAIREGVFPAARYIEITEINLDGRRDCLANSVLAHLCRQMVLALESDEPRQHVTLAEVERIAALYPPIGNDTPYARIFGVLREVADRSEALRNPRSTPTDPGEKEQQLAGLRATLAEVIDGIEVTAREVAPRIHQGPPRSRMYQETARHG